MLVGQIDAAHPMIALPDHVNDLRRLDDVEGFERPQELARHAARKTARLCSEGHLPLALQYLVVRLLNLGRSPRLEDWIFGVRDAVVGLSSGSSSLRIADEGIGRIFSHRTVAGSRWRVLPVFDVRLPAEILGRKLRNSVLCGRRNFGRGDERDGSAADQKLRKTFHGAVPMSMTKFSARLTP